MSCGGSTGDPGDKRDVGQLVAVAESMEGIR